MILIIDNYDSFTYNLVQRLGEIDNSLDIRVYRNDQISLDEIALLKPARLIVSPGPCTPTEAGISVEVVKRFGGEFPILGVCLGHQVIGYTFDSDIEKAPSIFHGKTSLIKHNDNEIFKEVPNPFNAMRYHSLIINEQSLNKDFDKIAWTEDGLVMGIAHKTFPMYGIQFHPESIGTDFGEKILLNFLNI